jgi:prepilin-type N-terminal cleavage/methylation domain-containing protein
MKWVLEHKDEKSLQKHSLIQGFTLVELAIVLIIVGLIIGGILKGQELVRVRTY